MKIATKFLSSSITVCTLIVILVGGTNFWVRYQEEHFEIKKETILNQRESLLQLEALLDEQIDDLKDFLVLNRNPQAMAQYQKAKSRFIIVLNELKQNYPDHPTLQRLNERYQNLQSIADNLASIPEENEIVLQDLLSINSFRRDIDFYLVELNQEIQAQLAATAQEEEEISDSLTRVVWILILLIILLMLIQYRLVVSPVLNSLNQFTLGVKRVSAGDFKYRLSLTGDNELTNIAQNFNYMTDILEELYEDLEGKVEERTVQLEAINGDLKVEILKREKIEEELRRTFENTRRSQQLLLSIVDATPDWIFVKDPKRRFLLVNKSFADHFQTTPDQIVGKTINELKQSIKAFSFDQQKSLEAIRLEDEAVLQGKSVHNPSDHIGDEAGNILIFDTQKMPLLNENQEVIGILGVSRNITERHLAQEALQASELAVRQKATELESTLKQLQQTQAQIVQSEKMSSLGQMVAGVAHEINNPVNFIFGNIVHAKDYIHDLMGLIKLYQQEYPEPTAAIAAEIDSIELDYLLEDIPKLLNSMTVGAERIRDIVKSLRTFSRLDEAEMKQVDIHDGIDSTLMILHNRIKEKQDHAPIQIVKNYGKLPLIECYAGQLNQVFMNILSNAIDSLDEYNAQRDPADIQNHPSQITITTEKLASIPGMAEWVAIRIKDNGQGIPLGVQQKLFEPFFTTKDVGKGTGLGLSISHSIVVEKHGGQLSCYSEIGKGAEFTIEIPVTAVNSPQRQAQKKE